MTLADVEPIMRFWKRQPPASVLLHAIAIWCGAVKPQAEEAKQPSRSYSIAELKALFPDGYIRG